LRLIQSGLSPVNLGLFEERVMKWDFRMDLPTSEEIFKVLVSLDPTTLGVAAVAAYHVRTLMERDIPPEERESFIRVLESKVNYQRSLEEGRVRGDYSGIVLQLGLLSDHLRRAGPNPPPSAFLQGHTPLPEFVVGPGEADTTTQESYGGTD